MHVHERAKQRAMSEVQRSIVVMLIALVYVVFLVSVLVWALGNLDNVLSQSPDDVLSQLPDDVLSQSPDDVAICPNPVLTANASQKESVGSVPQASYMLPIGFDFVARIFTVTLMISGFWLRCAPSFSAIQVSLQQCIELFVNTANSGSVRCQALCVNSIGLVCSLADSIYRYINKEAIRNAQEEFATKAMQDLLAAEDGGQNPQRLGQTQKPKSKGNQQIRKGRGEGVPGENPAQNTKHKTQNRKPKVARCGEDHNVENAASVHQKPSSVSTWANQIANLWHWLSHLDERISQSSSQTQENFQWTFCRLDSVQTELTHLWGHVHHYFSQTFHQLGGIQRDMRELRRTVLELKGRVEVLDRTVNQGRGKFSRTPENVTQASNGPSTR